jgi:hypothetical protein
MDASTTSLVSAASQSIPRSSRSSVRERLDGHLVGVEQSRYPRLPRSATPGLSDDSSRNDDSAAILAANFNQRSSCPIAPLHGDQRAGIENEGSRPLGFGQPSTRGREFLRPAASQNGEVGVILE